MLPLRPTIELVVTPVLSVVTELDTVDSLSRMTEPAVPDDAFDDTVLPSREVILPGETVLPSRDVIVPDETVLPSREVIVLVSGPAKRAPLERLLESPIDPAVPASALRLHSRCTVLADREASP